MRNSRLLWWVIWLALAGAVYHLADRALNPNRIGILGDAPSVTLQRGLDGHYRAEALINGVKVNVLVDTGATGVAISPRIAERLQLKSNQAVRTSTANGETVAYMTRLQSVQLGGVKADNVAAVIAPGLDGDVLLGMSFLARMDVRLFQGKMTITQVEE
ncbi:retropepsin-like aspartic protease family protein [Methylobacillus flagellatus]|uniref:Peptidase A2A, retrovirus, catalytic n=1 Tax=Methylobacillus flagellatus (strain ATCC 51484 / DSM 6875 / VKM B-1610 / KT) TaxID=265072 RepID=Q1GZZ8_METFK|nr:retropepsin-like aspartic protease [Methylobacillus flagellatus]ABE50189.1 peptidase A2A, retrovirus, catalytic [Methylobacillus flagellatus KT]